jgi:hypothetical protein
LLFENNLDKHIFFFFQKKKQKVLFHFVEDQKVRSTRKPRWKRVWRLAPTNQLL